MTIDTLDALYSVIANAPRAKNSGAQSDYAAAHGLPVDHGEIDLTSLPTFGGEVPRDTRGVWSWDRERLLIGESTDDLKIVTRAEHAELLGE